MHIEDYAVVGDTQSVALVSKDGSIDWLCLPRFDSGACFAALLGTEENGYWRIAPACAKRRSQRRYRADTLILETEFQTDSGVVRLIDSMPIRGRYPDIVRIVEGVSGRVAMRSDLVIRFDYGLVLPWVRRIDGKLHAIAGPDAVVFETAAPTRGENMTTVSEFEICAPVSASRSCSPGIRRTSRSRTAPSPFRLSRRRRTGGAPGFPSAPIAGATVTPSYVP